MQNDTRNLEHLNVHNMKLALAMICKASDEEAAVLDRCLDSFDGHVDGMFITITGKNKACEAVCKKHGAVVSTTTWENDFAKARNFSFAQVPNEYDFIVWADADDVVRGVEKIKPTIDENQGVDAFVFNYLYAFDQWGNPVVVHMKTRVVKNDGCVEWRGRLHEDFSEQREMQAKFVSGIEWLHITDGQRIEDSKARNVAVADAGARENPDDPRTYWNLGNAHKAAGDNVAALDALTRFLELSKSEEEKYVALARISEIHVAQGSMNRALDTIRTAIGMRPLYPDAHIASARILLALNRLHEARDACITGLQMEPPYHKIIVYNPRDYDLEPLKLLAEIYFQMSMPQLALTALRACQEITPKDENLSRLILRIEVEAKKAESAVAMVDKIKNLPDAELAAEFEKIDPEIRSHPTLTHLRNTRLIKRTSSGKDVVFFCGFTDEEWTPKTAQEKGIGGSEEAVIHLSSRLAKRGYNVTVYNNCGYKQLEFDGVVYRPFWEWNYRDKQDVVIGWRSPRVLDYEINADKVFLDMHDVVGAGEFTEARVAVATKIFFKSMSHRRLFPGIPDEKCVIVPNGIDSAVFSSEAVKEPGLIINTSSPDRGLKTLLNAFKRVREAVPTARLQWAYGWGVWDSVFSGDAERIDWKNDVIALAESIPGVEMLGRLGHGEVAEMYKRASIFAYPTAFYEIDCISARKAQAGGAWPIVTDFAALDETVQFGVKVKTDAEKENWGKPYQFDFSLQDERAVDEWVAACIHALQNPPTEDDITSMREWTKQFDWEVITDRWEKVLK